MLNEEKIRLMTGIAMFEKRAEKNMLPAGRQFKSDYVSSHMIRSFITYTFTCVIVLCLWVLYRIEDILDTMDVLLLIDTGKRIGILFVLGLAAYLFITWWVYSRRYDLAAKSMKVYQAKLKRLEKRYGASQSRKENEGDRQR